MNVSAHLIETILSRWSDRTLIESPDSSLSFSRFFEKASLLSEKLETEPGDRVFLRSKDQELNGCSVGFVDAEIHCGSG